nr:hypothetical protein HmN_000944700 [Hymenolepis microstoma]
MSRSNFSPLYTNCAGQPGRVPLSERGERNQMEQHLDTTAAIENDLETNFCLLRRIKCNLPYRQNWMQFLTSLTQKNREAAFNYYKAAFKDVRQCGRCISSVHRLLALLSKGKSGNEETMLTIQHLTISNSACEALCYDIWLHLLEMIIFLERFKPQKIIDKSTISTFHYQGNWPKELPNGSKRVWNLADDDESLTKRRRAQLWYSCLNDRILLEKLENKDQLSGGGSSRHVTFENGQDLLQSTGNKLKSPVPAGELLYIR